ncbi:MAG: F0F1 ATP synthase subunit alpha [Eubacteriales bacterium]|nr:F0F1 ATP synthase subunit alpha [Eubacteriales bacterium]
MTKTIGQKTIEEDFSAQKFADTLINNVKNTKMDIGVYQLGRVVSISDGICWLDGLADIMYGEVVEFISAGERGMILDIEPCKIGCIVFGRYEHIEAGDKVRRIKHMAAVPVGEAQVGRVVNPLGVPIDGLGTIRTSEYRPVEFHAPAILDRQSVSVPLHTGIKAIDALVPIGRGQRELIIGDRQTGKTSIAVDTIINQKGKNVICIYVAVGQKETTVADIMSKLKKFGAMEYTVIVCADAYSSASMQYIAPFAGTAIGEYFMYKGRDVLMVYDDLSKHAVAYRELSLLLHRPSGREAYPGDVFYLHSRLLERSARLSAESGGGSMTALPIIETQAGDISAYIPTNVISITDGQIFLETGLFNEGQRPAVNVGLSVSRVGGAAQNPFMKKTAASLRLNLAQYRELESFAQFGSDVDENTKKVLESGARIMAALNQPRYSPLPDDREALIIFAVTEGYAAKVSPADIGKFEKALFEYFDSMHSDLLKIIGSTVKPSSEDIANIKKALTAYVESY